MVLRAGVSRLAMGFLKATVFAATHQTRRVFIGLDGRWCALSVRQFKLFFLIAVYAGSYTDLVKFR